jgi:hypothetical protein
MGLAFGILYSCMNITLVIIPSILGAVEDASGYESVCAILLAFAIIAIIFNVCLIWYDRKKQDGLLDLVNPYLAMMGDEKRSVVLSVNKFSYILDIDKSFNLR